MDYATFEATNQLKYKLYRTFLNTLSNDDFKFFKQFKNKLTQQPKLAEKEIYSAFLEAKNVGNFIVWARLNYMLKPEKHQNQLCNLNNDEIEFSGIELANAFNKHFTTIAARGSSQDACKYINGHNDKTIFLEPVSIEEVVSVV